MKLNLITENRKKIRNVNYFKNLISNLSGFKIHLKFKEVK